MIISGERPYNLEPLPGAVFGKEVRGFSLKDLVKTQDEKIINQIIMDVRTHRAVVFRDQVIMFYDMEKCRCNRQNAPPAVFNLLKFLTLDFLSEPFLLRK